MELRASNDYWIYIRNGRAKKVYQDFKGAIDEYGKAINICPNLCNAYFYRANINFFLKNYYYAIKDYSEALRKNNLFVCETFILQKRGKCFLILEKYREAIEDLTKALNMERKPILYLMRGYSYAKKNRFDLALIDIGKSIELEPDILKNNKNILEDLPGLFKGIIKNNILK